ncbi:MAG: D-alanine--D-alanine ligase [Gammaproteobacteria bacterium RBG_16_51_14]|nr:MAG: D-alanine--D-alanine ligase [Gammaproteobacteria bacterium RBG_16_51_14]
MGNVSQINSAKRMTGKQREVDVLGPVEDLESYVRADWWRHIFNANYLRTDGDVVNDINITSNEVEIFLDYLDLEPEVFILDLCCGQGRHSIEIASRGFTNVFGLDRSHYLVTRARSNAKKAGLNVKFKEGDARKLPYPNNHFDAVTILGNSFGYFESKQDDVLVLKEVLRVLKPQGKLLIDITDGEYMQSMFVPRSWEWIDKNYFVCRERSLSSDRERLISREVITHVKKGVVADQFYAERLYNQEEINKLLKTAGFCQIELKHKIETDSQRAQDLGMMAQRIVIKGIADKKDLPAAIQATDMEIHNIAVFLGDPTRSDIIKPSASFDEDDFFTIAELKRALADLTRYKFTFVDNHEYMIRNMMDIRKECDLVLNLCDEGFNNDARKELHVAALLEMFDIPYTGGTPQCLAHCYDKSLIRGVAKEMDIPVPDAYLVKPEDTLFIDITIPFPVIIKPNYGDSSFGITQSSVCYNVTQLEQAILNIRNQFGYDKPLLIEQFLTGKDISVGIIGNSSGSFKFLPIIQEDYSALPEGFPRICGYEAKWQQDSPYWSIKSIPADLPTQTEEFLFASCLKLFERMECRDYARFDWRLDRNETPRLLEINPNPGWCWDGHLAKMAKIAGITYEKMLYKIIQAAEKRLKLERLTVH